MVRTVVPDGRGRVVPVPEPLEGLQVVNQEGQLLGKVDHLLETGSNDVMVVKPCAGSVDQRERLLPYLPGQFVIKVDLETQVMQVDWDAEF